MVADHAPGLAAVEGPDREHVLRALVEVGEHRARDVGLQGLVHEVEQGMEGPVGVPEGEGGIVGESFGPADGLVVLAEATVRVLEEEGVLGGAVNAGIEGLTKDGIVARKFVFAQFLLPLRFSFGPDGVEVPALQFLQVQERPVRADGGNRHLHADLLAFDSLETHDGHQFPTPGLQAAAEAFGVVDDGLAVLQDAEVRDGGVEACCEVDVTVRVPAGYDLASDDRVLVQQAHRGPFAGPAERVVQVHGDPGFLGGRIGEAEHAAAGRGRHLCLRPIVREFHGIVAGGGPFPLMREAAAITAVGVLGLAGDGFYFAGAGNEEEIAQVRDARAAEVRQAESHDRGFAVLVSGRGIVIIIVGVRADLDAAEGHLRPRKYVPESVRPDERIDPVHQPVLRCRT